MLAPRVLLELQGGMGRIVESPAVRKSYISRSLSIPIPRTPFPIVLRLGLFWHLILDQLPSSIEDSQCLICFGENTGATIICWQINYATEQPLETDAGGPLFSCSLLRSAWLM